MRFKVVDFLDQIVKDTVYLFNNQRNDGSIYKTFFNVTYYDTEGKQFPIGSVKIGQKGQIEKRPDLPRTFDYLSEDFFSLGANEDYYENLKKAGLRNEYFMALKDMAFDLEIFLKVREYDVTKVSLMHDITSSTIQGQFHRMAHGGAKLTDYNFTYFLPQIDSDNDEQLQLSFKIEIEKIPPTNIHVLIGKNGVGKTTILKKLLSSIEIEDSEQKYGKVEGDIVQFANIVYVSFSAFDKPFIGDGEELPVPYTFVGLIGREGLKTRDDLAEDFLDSLCKVTQGTKHKLWTDIIDILESDSTFMDLQIKRWTSLKESDFNDGIIEYPQGINESAQVYSRGIEKEEYREKVYSQFNNLSSGHKAILLTIVKLIELVEEKTLVLLDEPEEHLHPPLVSAFIRALSNLLTFRNGVGIIATHSPVIVQEIPKKCVWILRRYGEILINERPEIETFGENLGELTSEIFGYEVTNSGFHKMLQETSRQECSYKDALAVFNNELGNEAKAILRSYMYEKEYRKDD